MNETETRIRAAVVAGSEVCALGTLIGMIATGQTSRLLLAGLTVVLILLPYGIERLFACRINLAVYLFCVAYALASMFGQCWNFYYRIQWWDKLLHVSGGVLFAIVGVYWFQWMVPQKRGSLVAVLFGLLFSMAVALVWEFAEFFMDRYLGIDMQNDTVITGFCSYLLGDKLGQTATIQNITSVLVNGVPLPVDGYIDVGLTDTMLDLLLESGGAAITCLLIYLDRDRHPLIASKPKT